MCNSINMHAQSLCTCSIIKQSRCKVGHPQDAHLTADGEAYILEISFILPLTNGEVYIFKFSFYSPNDE